MHKKVFSPLSLPLLPLRLGKLDMPNYCCQFPSQGWAWELGRGTHPGGLDWSCRPKSPTARLLADFGVALVKCPQCFALSDSATCPTSQLLYVHLEDEYLNDEKSQQEVDKTDRRRVAPFACVFAASAKTVH